MRVLALAVALLLERGCALPEVAPPEPARARLAREATDTPAVPLAPDCGALTACPELEIDPARCVDDPALFRVSMLGALVADVEVIEEQAAQALEPGEWATVIPDPAGGCRATVLAFVIEEPPPNDWPGELEPPIEDEGAEDGGGAP